MEEILQQAAQYLPKKPDHFGYSMNTVDVEQACIRAINEATKRDLSDYTSFKNVDYESSDFAVFLHVDDLRDEFGEEYIEELNKLFDCDIDEYWDLTDDVLKKAYGIKDTWVAANINVGDYSYCTLEIGVK